MSPTEIIIRQFEIMIQMELESIQLQIKLIKANQSGHFTLNKIIVKDAKQYIYLSKQAIKTFMELINKYEDR